MDTREADRLWATVGRRGCESCGVKEVSPHHVVGRRNRTLRWDLRNRVWLCFVCHRCAHDYPVDFLEWFRRYRPEDYKYLMERKSTISKWTVKDMEGIIDRLKGVK